jgi:NAD(P)-dependent dehydrogenase (short-subunit alcohol dehydrogenase family)
MPVAQSVLIVGASRGIGLGLAEEFVKRGWQVTGTVRDAKGAAALGALPAVQVETADIADVKSVEALRDKLNGAQFDAIIVNAGVGGPQANPRTVSDEEFTKLFVTNSLAPVRFAEIFSGHVKPKTGVVGLMTSVLGSVEGASAGGFELYRGSKAALNSLTRSFAARHQDKALAILSLHPGWVKTDMGGPGAAIDVATSAKGLADVVERAQKDRQSGYFDYTGATIPW